MITESEQNAIECLKELRAAHEVLCNCRNALVHTIMAISEGDKNLYKQIHDTLDSLEFRIAHLKRQIKIVKGCVEIDASARRIKLANEITESLARDISCVWANAR
jgi:predicted  nucleic acid-binding Zn-ribbon protein